MLRAGGGATIGDITQIIANVAVLSAAYALLIPFLYASLLTLYRTTTNRINSRGQA